MKLNFLKNLFGPKEKVNMLLLFMGLEEQLLSQVNNLSLPSIKDNDEVIKGLHLDMITLDLELTRLKGLGLSETKNYQILKKKYDDLDKQLKEAESYNTSIIEDKEKAELLVRFVKDIKDIFGKKSYISFLY